MAGNKLSSIDGHFFSDITALNSLDVSRNNVSSFPVLGVMFGLQYLNVSYNQISSIPADVFVGEKNVFQVNNNELYETILNTILHFPLIEISKAAELKKVWSRTGFVYILCW